MDSFRHRKGTWILTYYLKVPTNVLEENCFIYVLQPKLDTLHSIKLNIKSTIELFVYITIEGKYS